MLRPFVFAGALLLSLALVANVSADGEQPAETKLDLNANAALKYWRGFANLPKLEKEEQERIVREPATMPLTPRLKAVVTLSESSLHELYNGAAVPACAWGLTQEDGIYAIIPEGSAARLLMGLACLRARLRFEEGNPGGALDDVFAAMTLGRHIGVGGVLISVLVGVALENTTLDVLAASLPKLDAATLKALPTRLDKLPVGGSVASGMLLEEKVFFDGFENKVRELKDRDKLIEFLALAEGSEDESQQDRLAKGKALLEECGGTAEGIIKLAEETRPSYGTLARKTGLPPDEFEKVMEAESKRMKKNPVFRLLFPAVVKCRQAEARLQIRRAMLRAAIAVQLDGKEALKAYPEPFGDGPFEYEAFDGGYELKSKFKYKDKPVTLTVGKRK